ncbi:MAG: GNAT family N-acetyltransferase [Acidimicrobiales bacterium]
MTEPTVRPIHDDELADFVAIARVALQGDPPTAEQVESRRKAWNLDRCLAAFDAAGRQCGSARAFASELTVPGGVVAAAGVSTVGVLPTHRRQGHLNRLMHAQLAEVAERGEPVAVLVAAEYPIYGRFGYGPATEAVGIHLDAPGPDGWVDAPIGTVELIDNGTFHAETLALYDRARVGVPGHIVYESEYWNVVLGISRWMPGDDQERRNNAHKVLWRDREGRVQGTAMYSVNDHWVNNRPHGELTVELLVATDDEAYRELVRFLAAVDWVAAVRLGLRPIDDPLPLLLHDGRRATLVDRSDHIWARVLDVPAALASRRYGTAGRLVLEVDDPIGFARGRFALDGGPDGATCAPTAEAPDLVVPAKALGAAYLGGQSWGRLAAAGWVDEARAGALARASAMFTTAPAPWCAMTF